MSLRPPRGADLPYIQGWFQVAWSRDLRVGQLRKITQFGRAYTLFRGEDGQVGLLDDVCPHLGARFSSGGAVVGNAVRCPYHAWRFDRGGQCTHIPYSDKIPVKARVRSYTVAERYGLIFMYRDQAGGPPAGPLPEIEGFDPDAYSSPAHFDFHLKVRGQDIMENSVDSAHFAAVHGHAMPENKFQPDGTALRVTQISSVRRFGTLLKLRLEFHLIEPGFHYVHFPEMPGAPALVFSSIVPVDEHYTSHRMSIWIKKHPVPGWSYLVRRFLLWQMMATYREDMQIWENKEYLPYPVLCDGDGAILRLRRWYAQFYESNRDTENEGAAAPKVTIAS